MRLVCSQVLNGPRLKLKGGNPGRLTTCMLS
nr:MAG TPA: hypothetical protein [Bacteriophage sp.]